MTTQDDIETTKRVLTEVEAFYDQLDEPMGGALMRDARRYVGHAEDHVTDE